MIYIGLFVYTILIAWAYSRRQGSRHKSIKLKLVNGVWFLLMVIPAICVAGFRYGISIDYHKVYEPIFNAILYGNTVEGLEWGFLAVSNVLSHVIHEPWFLFFAYSAITIILFFVSFKESSSFFISVVLFFGAGIFFDSFNGIRQYLVVAVFAYCYRYIKEGDFKRYIIIMGLCTLIHTSALFTIPIFFLYKVKFNNKYVFVSLIAVFILRNQLYNLVISIIQLFPKYNMYLLKNTLSNQISFSTSGLVMALFGLIPCLIVQEEMRKTNGGNFLYNMVILGLIIAVCSFFLPFAERILYYTRCYLMFSIPYACSLMKKRPRKLWSITISAGMTCMTAIGIYALDWYAVLPYVSIFSK